MPPSPQRETTRYLYLDGVRGLASLMVAVCHYVIGFQPALLDGNAAFSHYPGDTHLAHTGVVFFYNPDFGVALFFVLSGFVLSASVAEGAHSWPALVLRRWIRLCLPILVLAILIWAALRLGAFRAVPMAAVLTKSTWLQALYPAVCYHIPLWTLVKSALFTFFSRALTAGYVGLENGVLWTMPVEMVGSIGLFALYCFGGDVFRRARGQVFVSLLAVAVTFDTPFYGFGLGLALFEMRRVLQNLPPHFRAPLEKARVPAGILLLLAGLWLGSTPYFVDPGTLYYGLTMVFYYGFGLVVGTLFMHHAGAACLIAGVLLLGPVQRALCTWPCRFLGRISFMLYLVQLPVLCTVAAHMILHSFGGLGYEHRAVLAFMAYIAVAIILAELATRFIDRPAIHLSRLAGKAASRWRALLVILPAPWRIKPAGAE